MLIFPKRNSHFDGLSFFQIEVPVHTRLPGIAINNAVLQRHRLFFPRRNPPTLWRTSYMHFFPNHPSPPILHILNLFNYSPSSSRLRFWLWPALAFTTLLSQLEGTYVIFKRVGKANSIGVRGSRFASISRRCQQLLSLVVSLPLYTLVLAMLSLFFFLY